MRNLDVSGATGVLIDPGASDDRQLMSIALTHVADALNHDLAADEIQRGVAHHLLRTIVAVQLGAAAAGSSQEHATGTVEHITGKEELVARPRPRRTEVRRVLHG